MSQVPVIIRRNFQNKISMSNVQKARVSPIFHTTTHDYAMDESWHSVLALSGDRQSWQKSTPAEHPSIKYSSAGGHSGRS